MNRPTSNLVSGFAPASASEPADQGQRTQALDPSRSILVQAPAGSGKTTLLTDRFLTLLGEVDDADQVVAITFTNAAAAEMRNRILDELRKPEPSAIAQRVLERSIALGWKLLDLPSQLRILTIDAFCRELALQQPLLSGLGGGLAIAEQPGALYRRAAGNTLEQISGADSLLAEAIERLLKWRDNNWQEIEDLLVDMLSKRDRWMQDFVLSQLPDWDALRERLERPFANAVRLGLEQISALLDAVQGSREEALALARFACTQPGGEQHRALAELGDFPIAPFLTTEEIEEAHQALNCLAKLLMTEGSTLRRAVDKRLGFPADRKAEKTRILGLIAQLEAVPGFEESLARMRELPPARYTEEDWAIVRACFTLLRHAAGQLKVVFAEAAAVDFIEVAQIAESVLKAEDGEPTDAAIAVADGIRHLLVDEFQDTSRRQHQLLASLIAAWPDRVGRTCFAVGDPMQSIYFFRDADAELFARVKEIGLELSGGEPLPLDSLSLTSNFRTTPELVDRLNEAFKQVFAVDDGSGVSFAAANPAREPQSCVADTFKFHLEFCPQSLNSKQNSALSQSVEADPQAIQVGQILELIESYRAALDEARANDGKYRVAILARTRASLAPIAQALREAAIPFRAVDLEQLASRPEVLDALSLGRALLNPEDRLAWLGVVRAPWCGLTLADLHALTSGDDPALLARPVPELLAERAALLSQDGRAAVGRLVSALSSAHALRASQTSSSLGTWLQQVWIGLGGADCCDATARANLDLLWGCLDRLPAGEQDLLGPALPAALARLTALPDPEASSDCGVQLMTIHKSKGLEFEVVIVPDLQAKTSAGSRKLLSWLERGLKPEEGSTETENSGEITEFLIAPLQPKGEDRGKSKAWVDWVYREREAQETRRILYVAATRAREELHLFARPSYKVEANGELSLANPSAGLLSTAWPAFEGEIRARFEEWKADRLAASSEGAEELISLAASAASGLFVVPAASADSRRPMQIRRLPTSYKLALESTLPGGGVPGSGSAGSFLPADRLPLFARQEGGAASRALGNAVHALLEDLARLRAALDWPAARAALEARQPRIAAQIRASGIAPAEAGKIASTALQLALKTSHDPAGQWILSPHPEAASEVGWTGIIGGSIRTVQVDRVFRAGSTPQVSGEDAWWIVDYKTHAGAEDAASGLAQLRPLFAAQLEAYALVLRSLHGVDAVIRAGLYYPRMLALDWWEV
jgi:ATP-dependent exoDNAse (exonuclease V) beta subunit